MTKKTELPIMGCGARILKLDLSSSLKLTLHTIFALTTASHLTACGLQFTQPFVISVAAGKIIQSPLASHTPQSPAAPVDYCLQSRSLGTNADPYLILTPVDFTSLIASGDSPTSFFILCADLDFTSIAYVPITTLTGSLDGNGHSISNITFSTSVSGDAAGVGIFKAINGASITRLNLNSISITSTVGVAGALAGVATNANVSKVRFLTSTVRGTTTVGGILGDVLNSTLSHSSFSGSVNNTATGALGTGGLAGRLLRTDGHAEKIDVQFCSSSGTLTHGWYSNGGLIGIGGLADGTSVIRIENSHSDMSLSVRAWSGGLAGDFTGSIRNSSFTGSITSSTGGRTGGAIGNNIAGNSDIYNFFASFPDNASANITHASVSGYIQAGMVTLRDTFGATNKICGSYGAACVLSGASAQVTPAQLQTPSFFPGLPSDWSDSNIWLQSSFALPLVVGI